MQRFRTAIEGHRGDSRDRNTAAAERSDLNVITQRVADCDPAAVAVAVNTADKTPSFSSGGVMPLPQ